MTHYPHQVVEGTEYIYNPESECHSSSLREMMEIYFEDSIPEFDIDINMSSPNATRSQCTTIVPMETSQPSQNQRPSNRGRKPNSPKTSEQFQPVPRPSQGVSFKF